MCLMPDRDILITFFKRTLCAALPVQQRLQHQYHWGCLLIAAVTLEQDDAVAQLLDLIEQDKLAYATFGTVDFTLESLTLVQRFYRHRDATVNARIAELIDALALMGSDKTYFALDYQYLHAFNQPISVSELLASLVAIDERSGLLFDSFDKQGKGIPDLVYHCRNLEILIKAKQFEQSACLDLAINKAVSVLFELLAQGSLALFFGRSQHSLYGLGCLFYILNSIEFSSESLNNARDSYINKLSKMIAVIMQDAQLRTNLNSLNTRDGADQYMFPEVYSSFLLSRVCLAVNRPNKIAVTIAKIDVSQYFAFRPIAVKQLVITTCDETFTSLMMPNDYRYQANTMQVVIADGDEISLIPFKTIAVTPYVSTLQKLKARVLNRLYSKLLRHDKFVLPLAKSGFSAANKRLHVTDYVFQFCSTEASVKPALAGFYLICLPDVLLANMQGSIWRLASFHLPTPTGKLKYTLFIFKSEL